MENGIDLLGRLARIGFSTLSSSHCGEDGPTFIGLAWYCALCVAEFELSMEQHQVLSNLVVDLYERGESNV